MYSVTSAFLAAVKTSHKIATKVEVWGPLGLEETITELRRWWFLCPWMPAGKRGTCQITSGISTAPSRRSRH